MALTRLSRAALATLATAAVGCATGPAPLVVERGWGTFDGAAFLVPEGRYVVRWQATDEQQPRDGCLFGLLLDLVDDRPAERAFGDPMPFPVPKIAYEALPAASSRDGSVGPLELGATRYRFQSEGTCVWQAWLERAPLAGPEDDEPGERITNEQAKRH